MEVPGSSVVALAASVVILGLVTVNVVASGVPVEAPVAASAEEAEAEAPVVVAALFVALPVVVLPSIVLAPVEGFEELLVLVEPPPVVVELQKI